MKFGILSVVAAAAIAASSIPASADSIGDKEARAIGGNAFAKADADKDGKLSSEEFNAIVHHHFKKADKNGDGVINDEELGGAEANALIQLKEF